MTTTQHTSTFEKGTRLRAFMRSTATVLSVLRSTAMAQHEHARRPGLNDTPIESQNTAGNRTLFRMVDIECYF